MGMSRMTGHGVDPEAAQILRNKKILGETSYHFPQSKGQSPHWVLL